MIAYLSLYQLKPEVTEEKLTLFEEQPLVQVS